MYQRPSESKISLLLLLIAEPHSLSTSNFYSTSNSNYSWALCSAFKTILQVQQLFPCPVLILLPPGVQKAILLPRDFSLLDKKEVEGICFLSDNIIHISLSQIVPFSPHTYSLNSGGQGRHMTNGIMQMPHREVLLSHLSWTQSRVLYIWIIESKDHRVIES